MYVIPLRSTPIIKLQRDIVKSSTYKPKWNVEKHILIIQQRAGKMKKSELKIKRNEKEKQDTMVDLKKIKLNFKMLEHTK